MDKYSINARRFEKAIAIILAIEMAFLDPAGLFLSKFSSTALAESQAQLNSNPPSSPEKIRLRVEEDNQGRLNIMVAGAPVGRAAVCCAGQRTAPSHPSQCRLRACCGGITLTQYPQVSSCEECANACRTQARMDPAIMGRAMQAAGVTGALQQTRQQGALPGSLNYETLQRIQENVNRTLEGASQISEENRDQNLRNLERNSDMTPYIPYDVRQAFRMRYGPNIWFRYDAHGFCVMRGDQCVFYQSFPPPSNFTQPQVHTDRMGGFEGEERRWEVDDPDNPGKKIKMWAVRRGNLWEVTAEAPEGSPWHRRNGVIHGQDPNGRIHWRETEMPPRDGLPGDRHRHLGPRVTEIDNHYRQPNGQVATQKIINIRVDDLANQRDRDERDKLAREIAREVFSRLPQIPRGASEPALAAALADSVKVGEVFPGTQSKVKSMRVQVEADGTFSFIYELENGDIVVVEHKFQEVLGDPPPASGRYVLAKKTPALYRGGNGPPVYPGEAGFTSPRGLTGRHVDTEYMADGTRRIWEIEEYEEDDPNRPNYQMSGGSIVRDRFGNPVLDPSRPYEKRRRTRIVSRDQRREESTVTPGILWGWIDIPDSRWVRIDRTEPITRQEPPRRPPQGVMDRIIFGSHGPDAGGIPLPGFAFIMEVLGEAGYGLYAELSSFFMNWMLAWGLGSDNPEGRLQCIATGLRADQTLGLAGSKTEDGHGNRVFDPQAIINKYCNRQQNPGDYNPEMCQVSQGLCAVLEGRTPESRVLDQHVKIMRMQYVQQLMREGRLGEIMCPPQSGNRIYPENYPGGRDGLRRDVENFVNRPITAQDRATALMTSPYLGPGSVANHLALQAQSERNPARRAALYAGAISAHFVEAYAQGLPFFLPGLAGGQLASLISRLEAAARVGTLGAQGQRVLTGLRMLQRVEQVFHMAMQLDMGTQALHAINQSMEAAQRGEVDPHAIGDALLNIVFMGQMIRQHSGNPAVERYRREILEINAERSRLRRDVTELERKKRNEPSRVQEIDGQIAEARRKLTDLDARERQLGDAVLELMPPDSPGGRYLELRRQRDALRRERDQLKNLEKERPLTEEEKTKLNETERDLNAKEAEMNEQLNAVMASQFFSDMARQISAEERARQRNRPREEIRREIDESINNLESQMREFEQESARLVREGKLTQDQVNEIKEWFQGEIRGLRGELENLDRQAEPRRRRISSFPAFAAIDPFTAIGIQTIQTIRGIAESIRINRERANIDRQTRNRLADMEGRLNILAEQMNGIVENMQRLMPREGEVIAEPECRLRQEMLDQQQAECREREQEARGIIDEFRRFALEGRFEEGRVHGQATPGPDLGPIRDFAAIEADLANRAARNENIGNHTAELQRRILVEIREAIARGDFETARRLADSLTRTENLRQKVLDIMRRMEEARARARAQGQGKPIEEMTEAELVEFLKENMLDIDPYKILTRRAELRGMSEAEIQRRAADPAFQQALENWRNRMQRWYEEMARTRRLQEGTFLPIGNGSWMRFVIREGRVRSGGEVRTEPHHKVYIELKDILSLRPELLEQFMMRLAAAGVDGQLKIKSDGMSPGDVLARKEDIVMHVDNPAHAEIVKRIAQEVFGDQIKSIGEGADPAGRDTSHNGAQAEDIRNHRARAAEQAAPQPVPAPAPAPPQPVAQPQPQSVPEVIEWLQRQPADARFGEYTRDQLINQLRRFQEANEVSRIPRIEGLPFTGNMNLREWAMTRPLMEEVRRRAQQGEKFVSEETGKEYTPEQIQRRLQRALQTGSIAHVPNIPWLRDAFAQMLRPEMRGPGVVPGSIGGNIFGGIWDAIQNYINHRREMARWEVEVNRRRDAPEILETESVRGEANETRRTEEVGNLDVNMRMCPDETRTGESTSPNRRTTAQEQETIQRQQRRSATPQEIERLSRIPGIDVSNAEYLGSGASGIAFLVTMNGRRVVVKLPVSEGGGRDPLVKDANMGAVAQAGGHGGIEQGGVVPRVHGAFRFDRNTNTYREIRPNERGEFTEQVDALIVEYVDGRPAAGVISSGEFVRRDGSRVKVRLITREAVDPATGNKIIKYEAEFEYPDGTRETLTDMTRDMVQRMFPEIREGDSQADQNRTRQNAQISQDPNAANYFLVEGPDGRLRLVLVDLGSLQRVRPYPDAPADRQRQRNHAVEDKIVPGIMDKVTEDARRNQLQSGPIRSEMRDSDYLCPDHSLRAPQIALESTEPQARSETGSPRRTSTTSVTPQQIIDQWNVRTDQRLPDQFAIPGEGGRPTANAEWVLFDVRSDPALAGMINGAVQRGTQAAPDLTAPGAVERRANEIFNHMRENTRDCRDNSPQRGRVLEAGPTLECGSVCRHQAPALAMALQRAGVNAVLRRGLLTRNGQTSGHMWVEITMPDGSIRVVDPTHGLAPREPSLQEPPVRTPVPQRSQTRVLERTGIDGKKEEFRYDRFDESSVPVHVPPEGSNQALCPLPPP